MSDETEVSYKRNQSSIDIEKVKDINYYIRRNRLVKKLYLSNLPTEDIIDELKGKVIGQDAAIENLVHNYYVGAFGLSNKNQPRNALLVGPTGTGKNYLIESFQKFLEENFVGQTHYEVIQANKYEHSWRVSELLGSPPGYVGEKIKSRLTSICEYGLEKPFTFMLIDEMEKGDPKLGDLFLGILENGTLHDAKNNHLNFDNVFIAFTSNLGYGEITQSTKASIGFNEESLSNDIQRKAINYIQQYLRPEFINRLNIVHFSHLKDEHYEKIYDLEIQKLSSACEKVAGIPIVSTTAARKLIKAKANIQRYGARNIANIIDREMGAIATKIILSDISQVISDKSRLLFDCLDELNGDEVPGAIDRIDYRLNDYVKSTVDYDEIIIDEKNGVFIARREKHSRKRPLRRFKNNF